MARCKRCGAQMDDQAVFCVHCGTLAHGSTSSSGSFDSRSGGFAFLSFLLPVVGLILFIIWRKQYPLRAKSCIKGVLIRIVLFVILSIITVVLSVVYSFSILDIMKDNMKLINNEPFVNMACINSVLSLLLH